MKIKFLSIMIIFSIPCAAKNYKQIRENFKSELHRPYIKLIDPDKHRLLIEPYIKKAENNLQILKCLMLNPNFELFQQYFECLLDYNWFIFNRYYEKPESEYFYKTTIERRNLLFNVVNEFKIKHQITNLDVHKEIRMTTQFLEELNKACCKQLSFFSKYLFIFN